MGRTNRNRGSRYNGHGKKARRGAGKRGGRGKAGAFKHRKMWIRKTFGKNYAGKYGFKRHPSLTIPPVTINVGEVAERWGSGGKTVDVDLTEHGIEKLLGGGRIDSAMNIKVSEAVPTAITKVEEAGGSVETAPVETETVAETETEEEG
jgi:large subunit ribosomal protein L15